MKLKKTLFTKLILIINIVMVIMVLNSCNTKKNSTNDEPKDIAEESKNTTNSNYQKISTEEGKKMLEEDNNIILLDVRTQEEFDSGHIPGSILIPYDTILENSKEKLKDKEQTIIIYCRSGRRSAIAANDLIKIGYKNVYDMGGIIDWPYEVEK
jgi:rhodanese-related sulfurtransferase